MMTKIAGALAKRTRFIVLAVSLAAGITAHIGQSSGSLEMKVDRLRQAVLPKNASGEVVVVGIDQESLERLQAWPWPRSLHGRLVDRLREMGARQVLMDIDFSSPAADPEQDIRFAAALRRAPGMVGLIGSADEVDGKPVTNQPNDVLRPHAATLGSWISVNTASGEISLPHSELIAGRRQASISSVAAGKANAASMAYAKPDWAIRYDTIPTISYADVIENHLPRSAIAGKTVIVGATASTMGDRWTVPDGYRIPGVVIHALGAETLLRGTAKDVGGLPALLLACALIAIAAGTRNRLAASLASATAGCAIIGASWLLRENTGTIVAVGPVVVAVAAALLTHLVSAIASGVMARLTTDDVTELPNITAMRIDDPDGNATVAVRLRNHLETATALGPKYQAELMRRVRDRIKVAAGDQVVYQVDEHSFAWRTPLEGVDLSDSVEGMVALFMAGIPLDGRNVDAPVTAGIFEGQGPVQTSVTAALLAADHASRQGLPWTRHQDDAGDAEWRVTMMSELDRALNGDAEAGSVWVAYQPKYDLRTNRIISSEALVRWTHPVRGPIRPDHFIPMLEEAGRIEKLTLFVLETAIRDFAQIGGIGVAVNLSTRMLGGARIVEPVRSLLAKYRFPAHLLTLEITESAVLTGDTAISELDELRDMGINISIDDYGTGQSTLNYLKRLPATELKVDQSFVRVVLTSKSDKVMIASTISLAHELGLKVVAEGVETAEVLEALRQLDCDIIQGYHIGKPMPLADFVRDVARDIVMPRATNA